MAGTIPSLIARRFRRVPALLSSSSVATGRSRWIYPSIYLSNYHSIVELRTQARILLVRDLG